MSRSAKKVLPASRRQKPQGGRPASEWTPPACVDFHHCRRDAGSTLRRVMP